MLRRDMRMPRVTATRTTPGDMRMPRVVKPVVPVVGPMGLSRPVKPVMPLRRKR